MSNLDISRNQSDQLYADQIRLLFENAPASYSITLINGAILVYVQSAVISVPILLAWYSALIVVTIMRAILAWYYFQGLRLDPHWWNLFYFIGTGLAGIVWGTTALLLFPSTMAHQIFLAFVLAGMAAGAMSVLAPRIEACMAFLLPELLPLAFRYLTLNTILHVAMGILILLFLIGISISALNYHRSIRTSLVLRFDKSELEQEMAQRRIAEDALFREKDRLQTALKSIGEGVVLVDMNNQIEYLNPAAEQICGHLYHDALHRATNEIFECFDISRHVRISTAMEDSLRLSRQVSKQIALIDKMGNKHCIEELATPLYDRQYQVVGTVSILRDRTQEIQKTEELLYAADHDALTGLPNRNLLKDRIKQAIARAQRKHENFALLFLDLNRFKEINDTLGHAAGDTLLVDVAQRLMSCVREEDTVARLGGDEFVVLLSGPTHETQVKAVAEKIFHSIGAPYQLDKKSVTISVSIGSSMFPIDGQDTETLLAHADSMMYLVKQEGQNRDHDDSRSD